jgi:hypothetical protein
MSMVRSARSAASLFIFAFATSFDAEAATRVVPATYATIGAALSQCSAGDTVMVEDGTYVGEGNINLTMPAMDVVLRSSNGPAFCAVDCQDQGYWIVLNDGQTRSTVVQGFTVTRGSGELGGAVQSLWADPTFRQCVFVDNHGMAGGAALAAGDDVLFEDCGRDVITCGVPRGYASTTALFRVSRKR